MHIVSLLLIIVVVCLSVDGRKSKKASTEKGVKKTTHHVHLSPLPKKDRKVLWFMAVQSFDKNIEAGYYHFVLAALNSARTFAPSLSPILLHPGTSDRIPPNVRNMPGVHLISHNLTFLSLITEGRGKELKMLGPWYRLDIPYVMHTHLSHLSKEDYDLEHVLYTDTDVLFFQDFNESTLPKPKVLTFGPEAHHNTIANSGVMYMNVTAMRELWPVTLAYAESRKWMFNGPVDQGLYLEFYTQYATLLDDRFNWKGYWGEPASGEVHIAHFHGPKPGGCLECYLLYRTYHKRFCHCPSAYDGLLGLVPDHGAMYERMLHAFRNFTHGH